MTWSDYPEAIVNARAQLAERFPDQAVDILDCFDIAWSGWEGDSKGALIALDGVPMLVAIDQTIDESRFEQEIIARMPEYRRLLDETERVLRRVGSPIMTPSDLLRAAAVAVVRELMADDDVMRLVAIADALEAAAGEDVPIAAAQALMDLKSARLRLDPPPPPPPDDDWTPDDDRAVAAGKVAEILDAMSVEQIERVKRAAQEIMAPDDPIMSIDTRRRPALHLQLKARDFIAEVYDLAARDEIEKAVALAIDAQASSGTPE